MEPTELRLLNCRDIDNCSFVVNFMPKLSSVTERQINVLFLCLGEIFCVESDAEGQNKHLTKHLAEVRVV
jgi:hypothetical protein